MKSDEKWGFLSLLGLVDYIIAWMAVISSPTQVQAPSTFLPVSPYHIILYAYLVVIGGLMYLVSPAVGIAAFIVIFAKPQPQQCPLYLRVWNSGEYMLTPENASSVSGISRSQLVYLIPPRTYAVSTCKTPLLLYTGPICCFFHQCEGAYYNYGKDPYLINLTEKGPPSSVELMVLPGNKPMIYYKASFNDGKYDITCQGLVDEGVYFVMLLATLLGAYWMIERWLVIKREGRGD